MNNCIFIFLISFNFSFRFSFNELSFDLATKQYEGGERKKRKKQNMLNILNIFLRRIPYIHTYSTFEFIPRMRDFHNTVRMNIHPQSCLINNIANDPA